MKFKILLLIALICIVFTAACLDSNNADKAINPLSKNIKPFESAYPENLPINSEIIWCQQLCFPYVLLHSNESLILESDVAFYGTVKSINPSAWTTANQNPPYFLSDLSFDVSDDGYYLEKDSIQFKNGTVVEYNKVYTGSGLADFIYTPVIFEVNDMVKGENTTEVTVVIESGQIGNYISVESTYPTIWDLEVGQEYLVYLRNCKTEVFNFGMENNTVLMVMNPGLFVII